MCFAFELHKNKTFNKWCTFKWNQNSLWKSSISKERFSIIQLAFGNMLSFQSFLEMYTAQLTFFPYLTPVRRLRSIDKGNHVMKMNYCERIQVLYRVRPSSSWKMAWIFKQGQRPSQFTAFHYSLGKHFAMCVILWICRMQYMHGFFQNL